MKGAITAGVALLLMAPPQQIFRVGVDAVAVDVLVTNGHEPIGGLTASDFELRDSGVLQRIDSVLFEDVPLSRRWGSKFRNAYRHCRHYRCIDSIRGTN